MDGEGCFTFQGSPRISVTNTHLPTLRYIARIHGGRITSPPSGRGTREHRPQFKWAVYADDATRMFRKLLPHLREKKQQAELIMRIRRAKAQRRPELLDRLALMKRPRFSLKPKRKA